ncbi:hypothetical protein DBB30_23620, partial [Yersinia pestis]
MKPKGFTLVELMVAIA